ncbi:MAG TPA: HAMP domain-containing sensor histidine kinase [Kofleriaceae bacterium]|nr:HAMP domain-containing sensor histidine kinase [Kofleriaceae bacterium]
MSGPPVPASSSSSFDLDRLVAIDELVEIVTSHAEIFGVGVAIVSTSGARLAAAGPGVDAPALGHHHIHPVYWGGGRVADIVLGPCLRRPERMPQGSVAFATREALASAIPELDQAELERYSRHVERVLLVLVRSAQDQPTFVPPAPAPQPADPRTEVERIKSNFLATVSHELRTPLTSVIGYSEMLLEGMAGPITEEQREYLNTILGKSDHLLRLITSMLELARMDAGPPPVERRPVSIVDVIQRAATSLTSEADRRAIALTLPQEPLPRVMADSAKIRQVLVHLIANAIKFTPRGGDVVVEATVGSLSPSDPTPPRSAPPDEALRRLGIRISVRDTGIGISPLAQARIFEPFYQVDQSSTREYGGTGLGLSLAKSYVEAHGGSIWVHSRPGEGSTFTLSLPAVPEDLLQFVAAAAES